MARTLDGARTRTVSLSKRNSRGRHYSVPPAILLAAATYWPRQHSFPARSANRCISPPIPICHCPRGPSLFSVRATGVPRIPVQISPIHLLRREASLPVLSPNDIFVLDFFFSPFQFFYLRLRYSKWTKFRSSSLSFNIGENVSNLSRRKMR